MQNDSFIFETASPEKMGIFESVATTHWAELLYEPQLLTERVTEMEELDRTTLSTLTRKIVNGFGSRNFDVLETAGVVSSSANRESLHPEESLLIDPEDRTDLRNLIPTGPHERYIDAMTQDENIDNTTATVHALIQPEPELDTDVDDVTLRQLRQAVDSHFAQTADDRFSQAA